MARIARQVAPGHAHHVTQQGSGSRPVFPSDAAKNLYLELLEETAAEHGVDVLAWCLLSDRVHLVLRPHDKDGLAMTLRRTHSAYGRALNARTGRAGSVWADRYSSCPVDKEWFYAVVKYVERLPITAARARSAESYKWSSAAGHSGKRTANPLGASWPTAAEKRKWSAWLKSPQPAEEVEAIESATSRGVVLGDPSIVKKGAARKKGRKAARRRRR